MKKPAIHGSFPPSAKDTAAVKETIEIITGRRGDKCDLAALESMAISNPPTQTEVEFLRAQLARLVRRLEE